jgi:uncharacterized membrane protein
VTVDHAMMIMLCFLPWPARTPTRRAAMQRTRVQESRALLGARRAESEKRIAAATDKLARLHAELRAVLDQRCAVCHNAVVAQKNVALHTPKLVKQHAQAIYQQSVVLKLMPQNNATQITEAERELISRWFKAGAPGP